MRKPKTITWKYSACFDVDTTLAGRDGRHAGSFVNDKFGRDRDAMVTGLLHYEAGEVKAETRDEALEIVSEQHPKAVLFSIIPE